MTKNNVAQQFLQLFFLFALGFFAYLLTIWDGRTNTIAYQYEYPYKLDIQVLVETAQKAKWIHDDDNNNNSTNNLKEINAYK